MDNDATKEYGKISDRCQEKILDTCFHLVYDRQGWRDAVFCAGAGRLLSPEGRSRVNG